MFSITHNTRPSYLATMALFSTMALLFSLIVVVAFGGDHASAAQKGDWVAGNILSDVNFTDKNNMSIAEIQSFLDSKIGTCDTWGTSKAVEYGSNLTRAQYAASRGWAGPPYTCLNKYYEVPKTTPGGSLPANNYSNPGSIPTGAQSAAWIIKDASNRYNISPKVLLVKIATESSGPLTSDSWPFFSQYRYAMGSHCPDSGPNGSANCDSNYAGFSIQLYSAAELMRWYLDSMDQPWWSYKKPYQTNNILWNVVNRGCGGANVYIQNKATAALYTYTPYQPNQAALDNMYGTGDNCSAYGNRNFWRVYWDWFGPGRFSVIGGILEQYNRYGGLRKLGYPMMNEDCSLTRGACYQDFEGGTIYWTPVASRGFTLIGGMRNKWAATGKEWGAMGYPTSDEYYSSGRMVQDFENGSILYYDNGASYAVLSLVEYGKYSGFGKPRQDTICGLRGDGCYQELEKATLYWTQGGGAQATIGGIRAKWTATGKEWGILGYPISDEYANGNVLTQNYEYGSIHYTAKGDSFYTLAQMNYNNFTYVGAPKQDTQCGIRNNGCYQAFEKGYIYQSLNTGPHATIGAIYNKWTSAGREWGALGYPTSEEYYNGVAIVQNFEFGKILWNEQNGAIIQYN